MRAPSRVAGALVLLACGCTTSTTEVRVRLASDAPADRVVTLAVTALVRGHEAGDAGAGTPFVFGGGGDGGAQVRQLPATFGLVPAATAPRDQAVTLVVDADIGPGRHGEAAVHFRRTARFAFTPHATTALEVFLPIECGDQTSGCTTVAVRDCTVATFCEERGQTCGDLGRCVSPDVAPAASLPDVATPPDATPPSAPAPVHALSFAGIPGSFHATDATSVWPTLAAYVDYVLTDASGVDAAHAAGMHAGLLSRPRALCVTPGCGNVPDPASLPEDAFEHVGTERVYVYATALNQFVLGDPSSASLASGWSAALDALRDDGTATHAFEWTLDEGVTLPDQLDPHVGSPTGPVAGPVYPGYTAATYLQNVHASEGGAHLPVIAAGYDDTDYEPLMTSAPNVLGGQCDGCFSQAYNMTADSGAAWASAIDAAIFAVGQGKLFVVAPGSGPGVPLTLDRQGYAYASALLVFDPARTVIGFQNVVSPSGAGVTPFIALVPTAPQVATVATHADLLRPEGVFAREFGRCLIRGRGVGACAVVVNSDPDNALPFPALARAYSRTLEATGAGAVTALGDDGAIDADGPPPAATVPARGWAVVFE